jgi:hypothetical protein
MKKYRLKKIYPGSPKLGEIKLESLGYNQKNYPEFWEEVKEKDYEILKTCPIEGIIYSIKRLSDGEVFTVGDKVDGPCGRNQKTVKISTEWIYYFDNKYKTTYTYRLEEINHSKEPLFVTEDGKGIFHERIPVVIYSKLTQKQLYSGLYFKSLHPQFTYTQPLFFAKKENALAWVEENKPQYSKKQVINILKGFDKEINEFMYEDGELEYSEYIEKYKNNENIL